MFTDKVSWRWCFYINLPLGAITLGFIGFFYRPTQATRAQTLKVGLKAKLEQFDIFGTIVFLPMVVCLLLALQWGGSQYEWSNGRIIALFVLFGVLLAVFVTIQFWKKDYATVPPRILKQRSIAAGAWFSAALGASFFVGVPTMLLMVSRLTYDRSTCIICPYGSKPSRAPQLSSPVSTTYL